MVALGAPTLGHQVFEREFYMRFIYLSIYDSQGEIRKK